MKQHAGMVALVVLLGLIAEGFVIWSNRSALRSYAVDAYDWLSTHIPQPAVKRNGPTAPEMAPNPWQRTR